MQRIFPVGENTLVAYSGDVSDAQYIQYLLETLMYFLTNVHAFPSLLTCFFAR